MTGRRLTSLVVRVKFQGLSYANASRSVRCTQAGQRMASTRGCQSEGLPPTWQERCFHRGHADSHPWMGTRLEERLRAYHAAALSSGIGDLKVGEGTFD